MLANLFRSGTIISNRVCFIFNNRNLNFPINNIRKQLRFLNTENKNDAFQKDSALDAEPKNLKNERKIVAGSNYFKNIAQHTSPYIKSLDEIKLDQENVQLDEVKIRQRLTDESNKFAKKILANSSKSNIKSHDENNSRVFIKYNKTNNFKTRTELNEKSQNYNNSEYLDIVDAKIKKNENFESIISHSKANFENEKSENENKDENESKLSINENAKDKSKDINQKEKVYKSEPRNWNEEIQRFKLEKRESYKFKTNKFKSNNSKESFEADSEKKQFKKFNKNFERRGFNKERQESFKKNFLEKNSRKKETNYQEEDKAQSFRTEYQNKQSEGAIAIGKESFDIAETSFQVNSSVASKFETQLDEKNIDDDIPVKKKEPTLRPVAYNLAYFVLHNVVLQKFIDMGVMIRNWDKDRSICEFVLKLDLERDVKPHLIFLHDIKIPPEKHAFVITKNPMFFKESLDDLNVRIEYLKSKKFIEEGIIEIVTKAPRWLNLPVGEVDTRLGWFQNVFGLTANELREIVVSRPKLITLPLKIASDVRFCLKDFIGFDDYSIKRIIKKYPKLFTKDFKIIEANYNYLTKVMKLSNCQIINYPPILQTPLLLVKTRYAYLKHLNRLQFDPTLPNFVSIKNIIEPDEDKFLEKYTKTSKEDYQKFLKSI